MIKEIAETEIPEELKPSLLAWQKYFREQVESQHFTGINWQGQDKNMLAHNSKEAYIEWFCALPPYNEPYRDKNFYVRELTMLSEWAKPEKIVELGTSHGIGSLMLAILNPDAWIHTIDINPQCKHEGDIDYRTGHISRLNKKKVIHLIGKSDGSVYQYEYHEIIDWQNDKERKSKSLFWADDDVGLCFIDADHTAESVDKDNRMAWKHRDAKGKWAIIWHDYNPDNPDLVDYCKAIEAFTNEKGIIAYHFKDGATLWTYGGDNAN